MGRLNRKLYWIGVVLWLFLNIGIIVVIQSDPLVFSATAMEIPAAVFLAFLVSGRLEDAGWSGWLSVGVMLPIMAVLMTAPAFVLGWPVMPWLDSPVMRPILALAAVALLALVVVAGVLRSAATAPAEHMEPTS